MKTNTKKITKILLILLFLILSFIIYFKIVLNKDIEYIAETKINNFTVYQQISSIVGLKGKLENANNISKSFDSLYVDRSHVLGFIEIIESGAEKNNTVLIIDNVNIDETHLKDALPYGLLNMTLMASGKYESIISLVKFLEDLPYFVTIHNVKMTEVESTKEWTSNISFSVLTN